MSLGSVWTVRMLAAGLVLVVVLQLLITAAGWMVREPPFQSRIAEIEARVTSAAQLLAEVSPEQLPLAADALSSPFMAVDILGEEEVAPVLRGRFAREVALADGRRAIIRPTGVHRRAFAIGLASLVGSCLSVLLLAALLLATRSTVSSMQDLAKAAETFSDNLDGPPMPQTGPRSVRTLAAALNHMQGRLKSLVHQRTFILASIAHDVRTHLTRLRLRAERVEPLAQREVLVLEIEQMARMVEDTLAYAQVSRGLGPVTSIDLQGLAHDLAQAHRELGRNVSVLDGPPIEVETDAPAIARALSNLIENAALHAGCAEVSIEHVSDGAALVVRDSGPGIPQDELCRVVLPFERLDASRSTSNGGSGLGLAIVAALVERAGAQFMLANRTGEAGLEAKIIFPDAPGANLAMVNSNA